MKKNTNHSSNRGALVKLMFFVVGVLFGVFGFQFYSANSPTMSGISILPKSCFEKNISVSDLKNGDEISFPLNLKVKVDNSVAPECSWTVFEAQAGTVNIKDEDGKILAQSLLKTNEEWMVEGPVNFTAKIDLQNVESGQKLKLEIMEEDPSGEGDFDELVFNLKAK